MLDLITSLKFEPFPRLDNQRVFWYVILKLILGLQVQIPLHLLRRCLEAVIEEHLIVFIGHVHFVADYGDFVIRFDLRKSRIAGLLH